MDKQRFAVFTTTPQRTRWADTYLARLVLTLSAFLLALGSLAYILSTDGQSELRPALALSSAPQHIQARTGMLQQAASVQTRRFTQIWHGNPSLPEIALTFDDGPSPSFTSQILAILQRFGVKATFFSTGQQAMSYPALIRQEVADGDLVEDHTWSHPNLTRQSAPSIYRQLALGAQAIEQVAGIRPTFFRPPYGAFNSVVLTQAARLNLSTIMWNVDPRDWTLPGSNAIVSRVLGTTSNGSIILLHDGGGNRSQTVAALPAIITALQARHFRFVTIQQLV